MMKLIEIETVNAVGYPLFEKLLKESFPVAEYRDMRELREVVEKNRLFHIFSIEDDARILGFISYWEFERFLYVEHFVIDKSFRGNKYGETAILKFVAQQSKPVVLEVEPPETEIAVRRINFYKRCDFYLIDKDYMQPPYRKGEDMFRLMLMSTDKDFCTDSFECVRLTIYKEVYGYE